MTSDMSARIDEIAGGIYRINTPVQPEAVPGGFSFNQYLVVDDRPLLFHSGPRKLFPLVRAAIERVMPLSELRYLGVSHVEADECGSMNEILAAAPNATVVCSQVAAMVSIADLADREPRPLSHGESIDLGGRQLRWFDAPHVPHGWDCGYMFDDSTRTLFCGDLFTQPGTGDRALVETDILGPSEAFRGQLDYYSMTPATGRVFDELAATEPATLACMHGSAWRGDGARLLRELRASVLGE